MADERVIIPRLVATVAIATDLSIGQVAERVGSALGITFSEDTEGLYEEIEALIAYAFGHIFGLYENDKDLDEWNKPKIYLDLLPDLYPTDLGLRLEDCQTIHLDIADYLAVLLRTKTGLLCEALPPVARNKRPE